MESNPPKERGDKDIIWVYLAFKPRLCIFGCLSLSIGTMGGFLHGIALFAVKDSVGIRAALFFFSL
jgi:hypothetical protein